MHLCTHAPAGLQGCAASGCPGGRTLWSASASAHIAVLLAEQKNLNAAAGGLRTRALARGLRVHESTLQVHSARQRVEVSGAGLPTLHAGCRVPLRLVEYYHVIAITREWPRAGVRVLGRPIVGGRWKMTSACNVTIVRQRRCPIILVVCACTTRGRL